MENRHYVRCSISTLCLVFDGGLGILDYIQWSLTGAYQMILDKTVYRRLSNAIEISGLSETVHFFL